MSQVAQFMWVGPKISMMEQLCLRSFLDAGYDVHFYVYDELKDVPEGVRVLDAGEIVPREDIFLWPSPTGGSYGPFSDKFRYHMLYKKGGWWFDTDHVAIRLLPEPTDLRIGTQWEGPGKPYATGSAIWAKPGDHRIGWLKDQCDAIIAGGLDFPYVRVGPQLMNEVVDEFGLAANLAPWWEFNPYPYYQLNRLLARNHREWLRSNAQALWHRVRQATQSGYQSAGIRPGTRAIHLYNEVWRGAGYDKTTAMHPLSTYGRLQRRHGVV